MAPRGGASARGMGRGPGQGQGCPRGDKGAPVLGGLPHTSLSVSASPHRPHHSTWAFSRPTPILVHVGSPPPKHTHVLSAYSIPGTGDAAGPKMGRAPAPPALTPPGTKQTKVKYESVASPALRMRPYPEIGSWRAQSVPTSREWRLRTRRGRLVPHTGARPREDRETGPQAKDHPPRFAPKVWLKTTHVSYFKVLEVGSLASGLASLTPRGGQDGSFWRLQGRPVSQPFPDSEGQHSWALPSLRRHTQQLAFPHCFPLIRTPVVPLGSPG